MEIIEEVRGDQNIRLVIALDDDSRVESVLYRGDTLCLSTQVGCAVSCPFCASGAQGLFRALTFEELRGQLELAEDLAGKTLSRVTLSGVGEPLHNFQAVSRFIQYCRDRRLGPSVTTSGGPLPRLRELLHLHHNGLTLSIHAGTEQTRAKAVPKGPALTPLFELLAEEMPRLSGRRRKKVGLAYLLVSGLNDSDEELDAFAERALPLGLWVHLYAYNAVPTNNHQAVSRARYEQLYERLRARGLTVRMSSTARLEAQGGCGTLVALSKKTPASNLK